MNQFLTVGVYVIAFLIVVFVFKKFKFFKYIEPLFTGDDGKLSLKRVMAAWLCVDFTLNVHNTSYVVPKVLNLVMKGKGVDASLITALSTVLAQNVIIIGIEGGAILGLMGITSWLTSQAPGQTRTTLEVTKTESTTQKNDTPTNDIPLTQKLPE